MRWFERIDDSHALAYLIEIRVMNPFLISRHVSQFSLLASFLVFGFSEMSVCAETNQAREPFPTSELSTLPYLYFSENNLGESCIFRMQQEECTVEINGQRYIGFQFLSTGLVEWLFINSPGDLEPSDWLLINDRGEPVGDIESTDIPMEKCPRVLSRYPEANRVTRYKTVGGVLEKRGRYHLVQKASNRTPAPYAISITSASPGSYEAGRSGKLIRDISRPPLRISTDVVIENMKEIRREKGMAEAADYLTQEMELRLDDQENASNLPNAQRGEARWAYTALYVNAWYEAQTGGGRLDADWASEVYGAMYEVCLNRGYFSRADVGNNLMGSLSSANRYGKLSEVFEIWKEGMRLGGYRMDTTSYRDLGSAFSVLPQVRKRDIPALAPYSRAKEQGIKVNSSPGGLSLNFAGCINSYATHLWFQGKWQESLEWLVWLNDWTSNRQKGGPGSPSKGDLWHASASGIADKLFELGFWEQALAIHEDALKYEINGGYEGKSIVRHQMSCLNLKRLIGQPMPKDSIDQARAYVDRAAGNIYEKLTSVQSYQANLGELLIHVGRTSEGEALLNELAAAGSRSARITRVKHWVKTGLVAGVEAELLALLKESREGGRKMEEIVFYRLYADFLEQQSRLNDALRIRRELVRLCQSFDIFTHLPVEMAKLASLLNRLGIWEESLSISNQARELLGKGGIPKLLSSQTLGILNGNKRGETIEEEKDLAIRVDFQPLQSVVIPLKGALWVSHITLANPSKTPRSGTLRATGLPVRFQQVDREVDLLATLGANDGDAELKVAIDPANYKIIALNAASDFEGHGKLSLSWTPDHGDYIAESHIVLEEAIGGTTKAIIQAGGYKLNPYYGIPVYHHYLDTEKAESSQPLRFVSSETARIEIYGMDGTPIAIDAQGNGSLRDPGDELFGKGDGNGNLFLTLTQGHTSFMILIYPQKELPDAGLSLRIESLEEDQWQVYAEDRLMPAEAGE